MSGFGANCAIAVLCGSLIGELEERQAPVRCWVAGLAQEIAELAVRLEAERNPPE
ncbi:hypothetical protein [Streptomyces sp. NPDC007264]|uniref:hypothetical protein n=1 Tax=Streptomyces sp. NPDC007264 TaxID=3364777 RepID=UPI0036D895A1